MKTTRLITLGLTILGFTSFNSALAAEHLVTQKGKAFSAPSLKIKAGDTVKFRNDDTVAHNIFSLSEAASFDLGSYNNGDARSQVFAKPGKVEVECALHPNMHMTIEVTP